MVESRKGDATNDWIKAASEAPYKILAAKVAPTSGLPAASFTNANPRLFRLIWAPASETEIEIVAKAESRAPSFTLNVKLSAPVNPALGVYLIAGAIPVSVPFAGWVTIV